MPILAAVAAVLFPLPARAGRQSALAPAGDAAERILDLANVMFVGGGLIFIAVMALAAIALFGPAGVRAAVGRHAWVVGGGILFPTVVLFALLVYSLFAAAPLAAHTEPPAVRVEVVGELWWWRVRYLDENGNPFMETANEIHIPVDRPVELRLTSDNVIHSFWVPNLAGKIDLIPGHVNLQRLTARQPGVFRGQCAEYCGAQHAKMALYVVAQPSDEYEAWLAAQIRPRAAPSGALQERGRQLFMSNRCALCHAIRGTPADGAFGPDLTHVGSRISIAGGIIPQNQGTIAGWIAESQSIKPGSKMPAYGKFTAEELRALSAWLASLS